MPRQDLNRHSLQYFGAGALALGWNASGLYAWATESIMGYVQSILDYLGGTVVYDVGLLGFPGGVFISACRCPWEVCHRDSQVQSSMLWALVLPEVP